MRSHFPSRTSTVAVMLWAMEPNVTVQPTLSLEIDGVFEGGVGGIVVDNPTFKQVRG